jgi:hypothetical protein
LLYISSTQTGDHLRATRRLCSALTVPLHLNRLTFLLKLVYPATRFFNALDPNAEPFVEPEWQHPGFFKGFLHLVLGFCVSIVPPPYAYAELN